MKKIVAFCAIIILLIALIINIPESRNKTRTQHFTFVFSSSIDTSKIAGLENALESNYIRISADLKTIPADNIEVNIYAHRWRYIKSTGNWGASGSIEGISKLHFIEQAWEERENQKVAVHEFTHAVVLKLLLDREPQPLDVKRFDEKFSTLPVWLWEAVSVYEAGQFIDPKTLPYLANGAYPGLDELNTRLKGGKIYSVGYTLIAYILDQYGQDKLIELIAGYGDLQNVLNVNAAEFSRGWYAFVKEKYFLPL